MTKAGVRRVLAASIAVVAAAAVPAPASAGEAHVETIGGVQVIVFTAAPGEVQSLLVDRDPGFTNDQYQLNDQNNPVTAGPGCQNAPRPPFAGTDPKIVRCDASATTIRISLGDGGDSVRFGNLSGHVVTDVVDGGEGDDSLDVSNGPSLVVGGPGVDTVDANGGDDDVAGGDGPDSIVGGPGSDTIAGDDGDDKILAYATPDTHEIGTVTNFRAGEVNKVSGGPGNDTIVGDNGTDEVLGEAGNDTINGAGGGDTLDGGAGNDTIDEGDTPGDPNGGSPAGPLASDTIRGGSGKDTATYCTRYYDGGEAKRHPLTISLDDKANDGEKGEKDRIGSGGDVENVLGGGVTSDKITGNSRANVLTGDCVVTFASGYGNNKIYGGSGNDKLVGSPGKDVLNGGKGADGFIGNEGADTIQAKDGKRDKSINCDGVGAKSSRDKATLDRSDPTAANCETRRF